MPNTNRQSHVQFRLDNEIFAIILERVAELEKQGTKTSVSLYCRALVLAGLGQSNALAFADEIALKAYGARNRIGAYIGALLEANMKEIVRVASLPSSEDE